MLQFYDFRLHRRRHFRLRAISTPRLRLQARFPLVAVHPHPMRQGAEAHAYFAGYLLRGEAFLQTQLHCFAPDFKRMGVNMRTFCPSRRPPRGAGPLPLFLNLACTFHR
jgi:hypothetical protein